MNVAHSVLESYLSSADTLQRYCAYLAYGLAYVCTDSTELEMLPEPLLAPEENIDVVIASALACGMVFAGTGNEAVCRTGSR